MDNRVFAIKKLTKELEGRTALTRPQQIRPRSFSWPGRWEFLQVEHLLWRSKRFPLWGRLLQRCDGIPFGLPHKAADDEVPDQDVAPQHLRRRASVYFYSAPGRTRPVQRAGETGREVSWAEQVETRPGSRRGLGLGHLDAQLTQHRVPCQCRCLQRVQR